MDNKQDIQTIVRQISDILVMNGGFLDNPGLYTGETGLLLFFSRYARFSQNDLYFDYAYELYEKIQNRIHISSLINYKQGLAGIGSAVEYLVQNGFFNADTDEVLEDFDRRIFFTYNLPYLSENEIVEIGYYAQWRLSGNSAKKDMIRQLILPQIETVKPDPSVFTDRNQFSQKTTPDLFKEKTYNCSLELIEGDKFWGQETGIQNGLAGWGISLLTELDGDDSCYSLFPI